MPLYGKIIIGMLVGILFGILSLYFEFTDFATDWIGPWGEIFLQGLKLIAIPLVFVSLVMGVASLSDIAKLSRMGGKTIILYLMTTIIAVTSGLLLVNTFQPGASFPEGQRVEILEKFSADVDTKQQIATITEQQGPLQFIVDMVPSNIFQSLTESSMLQIIVFALLIGISMVMVGVKAHPVLKIVDSLQEIILKMVGIIMRMAPLGVASLMTMVVVDFAQGESSSEKLESLTSLFAALGSYSLVVILGLMFMAFVIYPLLLKLFTGYPLISFYRKIFSVQMLAFSTSSSAATLPHTLRTAEEKMGVGESVASFVLPTGATINMDGTSLYQAVAAVFIAQAFGMDLDIWAQLAIVVTATLASIGSAAVPGAGIVMLLIVLEQISPALVPGAALVIGVDRILDMCRTVVNVTGDMAVSMIVAESEWDLKNPHKGILHWFKKFKK